MENVLGLLNTCPATSIGASYQLFGLLLNTILSSYCNLRTNWPDNYANSFETDGNILIKRI